MHTILGAGGPAANALTRELIAHHHPVRLVSRREVKFNAPGVSWQQADLLDYKSLQQATRGATVIYLCAGLVYDHRVWEQQWPVIMRNVIRLTQETGARFIFFDNIYMYGLVDGPMTEDTPYNPVSKKGEIRARVATTLMEEVKAGNLTASIARAPDFYGAESLNSFVDSMVLAKFAKGDRALWIGKPQKLHNFIYIPDAGRAVYLLGQHPESDNQIWHLPTAAPVTGSSFMNTAASVFGVAEKHFTVNKLMLKAIGLFDKVVKGSVEMYYQYNHDYLFNSNKFERTFNYTPVSYQQGITELKQTLFKQ